MEDQLLYLRRFLHSSLHFWKLIPAVSHIQSLKRQFKYHQAIKALSQLRKTIKDYTLIIT